MSKTTSKKNSTTGTTRMETKKSSLSGAEVCSIIEASAKAGLSELSFGELQISFVQKFGQSRVVTGMVDPEFSRVADPYFPQMQQTPPIAPSPYMNMSEQNHDARTKDEVENEEIRFRAEQLAELLITDPQKYEELLQQGELTDDSNDDDYGDEDAG